jgi:hypothetical protein
MAKYSKKEIESLWRKSNSGNSISLNRQDGSLMSVEEMRTALKL